MAAYTFFSRKNDDNLPKNFTYPCFLLSQTTWNDYGYFTEFDLAFYERINRKVAFGSVKILFRDEYNTKLPHKFKQLSDDYLSLGQNIEYYDTLLEKFPKTEAISILKSLNDISINGITNYKLDSRRGIETSLMRFSEAQKAFYEAESKILNKQIKTSFFFEFVTQIPSFPETHRINFQFTKTGPLPRRMAAIIGKNGSGKTQYLSRLASSLSGLDIKGNFGTDTLPPFSRIIAIAYSLFDRFEKPNLSDSSSYYYCGFEDGNSLDSFRTIGRRLNRAFMRIEEEQQITKLSSYITRTLGKNVSDDFLGNLQKYSRNEHRIFLDEQSFTKFSSGQIMLMTVLTEISAYIRPQSILLLDEPETHLHPNAISQFIGIIYEILKEHDSFAVIATHSPQIIQEIPSRSIFYFDADRSNPPVSELTIQTFGENLTTLTEQIFDTKDVDEIYKEIIRNLFDKYTKKEILQLFEKDKLPLSMNAKLFIEYQSMIHEKS